MSQWNNTYDTAEMGYVYTDDAVWTDAGFNLQLMDKNYDQEITSDEWLLYHQLMSCWSNLAGDINQTNKETLLSHKYIMFEDNYVFDYTEEIFVAMDANEDQEISYDEFMKFKNMSNTFVYLAENSIDDFTSNVIVFDNFTFGGLSQGEF